ncbi:MAG: TerC family protein [Gemmatimonadaceae bacterium]|nr:TerC family protein [Gemmatimonadaceae bacterium]
MLNWLADPNAWIGLVTLTALELVLGIDNVIFIAILAGKLPKHEQPKARRLGLTGALITRIAFLLSIAWIMGLTGNLFTLMGREISGRDLILIVGGLFLIAKATFEIHSKLEGVEHQRETTVKAALWGVVAQIMVVDIVFSVDSVITAVGMVQHVGIMIAANVLALLVMLWASTPISEFVDRHPTIKVLALAFLVMIGGNLIIEGFGYHVPKGYTYFAMAFSVAVEFINIRVRARASAVKLRQQLPA